MLLLVAIFGLFIAAMGILGCARPRALIEMVLAVFALPWGVYLVGGIRLAFGLLLLGSAAESGFPRTFQALGTLALISAATVVLLGRARVERFAVWWSAQPAWFIRFWSLAAAAFGAFLVVAVV